MIEALTIDYSMPEEMDVFLKKVEMILESPTERNKYKKIRQVNEKLDFLRTHFIMNEMAIRLMERKYLISDQGRDALVKKINDLIRKVDG